MKVLRLTSGEKTAVNQQTAEDILAQLLMGKEIVVASDIVFPRALFQSLMPTMK